MPTGYTADIKDGTSFEQFVWSCARAFGALVMLRDDATAPIPDRFEPSAYYAESVQKSEAELARLHSLTKEQASADCLAAYRQELESYNKRCTEKRELREKYLRMLAKAKKPTEEEIRAGLELFKRVTSGVEVKS